MGPSTLRFALADLAGVIGPTRRGVGWSQRELGRRSGVPQSQISLIERGRIRDVRLSDVDRLCLALSCGYRFDFRPPTTQPRQADVVHARCSGHVARRLEAADWLVAREVEIDGDRFGGWIDVLAFDPGSRLLLVIEIKTGLDDLGQVERQIARYERGALGAARRSGWAVRSIASALLLLHTSVNDRAISANRDALRVSFPGRADALFEIVRRQPARAAGRESAGAADREPASRVGRKPVWAADREPPSRAGREPVWAAGREPPARAAGREPVWPSGREPRPVDRYLAMIDPRSRRRAWIRPTRLDGSRTPAPYVDYIDAVRRLAPP